MTEGRTMRIGDRLLQLYVIQGYGVWAESRHDAIAFLIACRIPMTEASA